MEKWLSYSKNWVKHMWMFFIFMEIELFSFFLWSHRHWVDVTRNGNWCILISIHLWKYHSLYRTMKWIQFNMGYLCGLNLRYFQMWRNCSLFFVFRLSYFLFFILLFCDHQGTECELCEKERSIPRPMSTHKYI